MPVFPAISLVIPCFNEAERLAGMVQALVEFTQKWPAETEIIIVDDGSTDDWEVKLQAFPAMATIREHVQILRQANTGKGGALKYGVSVAKHPFILTLDADMAASPLDLFRWIDLRHGFSTKEILIGSRELPGSKVIDSPKRRFVGRVFNRIIRIITGLPYRDTQCGFKLYPASAAKSIFAALQTPGWAHDVEILLRANRAGYAVVQMPLTWKAVDGSKIDVQRDSLRMLKELIRIKKMSI